LKSTGSLKTTSVSSQNSGATGGQTGSAGKGIKPKGDVGQGGNGSGKRKPKEKGDGSGVSPRIVKAYTTEELEQAGYDVLCFLFNGGDEDSRAELFDFRKERGIGSDMIVGVDEVRQWVELKSYSCEPPSSITFPRNEFLRAREQGGKFYLAVVSGLAEGYVTEVRLIRNPYATVPWAPSGSVIFTGLGQAPSMVCKIDHS